MCDVRCLFGLFVVRYVIHESYEIIFCEIFIICNFGLGTYIINIFSPQNNKKDTKFIGHGMIHRFIANFKLLNYDVMDFAAA